MLEKKDIKYFLDYEIRSSWFASWISWDWMQEISAKYFAWKTLKKYKKYERSKMLEQKIKSNI